MTESDKRQFAEIWTAAWNLYGKDVTKPILQMCFNALIGYSIDEVSAGLSKHVQNPDSGQFAPKPADVVKHIGGGTDDRALLAWTKVERAVRCVGPYRSVAFDDPYVHSVIADMGGWIYLCEVKSDDDLMWRGKEFQRRYRGCLINPPAEYPKRLTGIAEQGNGKQKLTSNNLALIGNSDVALNVMKQGVKALALTVTTDDQLNELLDVPVKRIQGAA